MSWGLSDGLLAQGAAGVPAELLAEQVRRGAIIRRRLRLILVVFFVAVMITEPPARNALWCWVVVGGYLVWTLGVDVLRRSAGERLEHLVWVGLFVDMAVLAALTLITAGPADGVVDAVPVADRVLHGSGDGRRAAEHAGSSRSSPCRPWPCTSGPGWRSVAWTTSRSRTCCSAPCCWRPSASAAVLLTRLQRSRVDTIAALLAERNALLGELVSLQQREQRELAETLHDGALQYVLAARQELDDAMDGDQEGRTASTRRSVRPAGCCGRR